MYANFQSKSTTSNFFTHFCRKMDLGFENEKSNDGIRINSVCQFSVNMEKFDFFWLKSAQKWIIGSEFQKSKSGFRIKTSKIPYMPIFRKNKELWLFRPKFSKKWILVSKFQNFKSRFGISTCKIPCASIFNQNGQLRIFRPKFEEIAQLSSIFWFF